MGSKIWSILLYSCSQTESWKIFPPHCAAGCSFIIVAPGLDEKTFATIFDAKLEDSLHRLQSSLEWKQQPMREMLWHRYTE
jgi:hypothetical protein